MHTHTRIHACMHMYTAHNTQHTRMHAQTCTHITRTHARTHARTHTRTTHTFSPPSPAVCGMNVHMTCMDRVIDSCDEWQRKKQQEGTKSMWGCRMHFDRRIYAHDIIIIINPSPLLACMHVDMLTATIGAINYVGLTQACPNYYSFSPLSLLPVSQPQIIFSSSEGPSSPSMPIPLSITPGAQRHDYEEIVTTVHAPLPRATPSHPLQQQITFSSSEGPPSVPIPLSTCITPGAQEHDYEEMVTTVRTSLPPPLPQRPMDLSRSKDTPSSIYTPLKITPAAQEHVYISMSTSHLMDIGLGKGSGASISQPPPAQHNIGFKSLSEQEWYWKDTSM